MKGWTVTVAGNLIFYFTVNENGELELYYEDNKVYPNLYVDELGDLYYEQPEKDKLNFADSLYVNENGELVYVYESANPPISLFLENNELYAELNSSSFEKYFRLDEEFNLIHKYNGLPPKYYINDFGQLVCQIDGGE